MFRAGLPITVWLSGILELWKQNLDGSDIVVGVVDTRVDTNHPSLKYGSNGQVKIPKVEVMVEGSSPAHGTGVASIIGAWTLDSYRGIAYNCTIYNYAVADSKGHVETRDITRAVRACIRDCCNIINISIGGEDENVDLRNAIVEANRAGITIVTSSGNTGEVMRRYPSSYPETISVASLEFDEKIGVMKAPKSTSNDRVTCSAIGSKTTVAEAGTSGYRVVSGTSYAAPVITGFCCLLMQKYKRDMGFYPNPSTLRTILESYSVDLEDIGRDVNTGVGFITAYSNIGDIIPKDNITLLTSRC